MKRPELIVENGAFAGRRFPVTDGGIRLGRSSSNDICMPDEELSRNHCLFEPFGEAGIRVTDLASANGTYVNGASIGSESVELHPGDAIDVGTTRLRISNGEPPASAAGVDLGLDTAGSTSAASDELAMPGRSHHRAPLANVLWCVVVALFGLGIYLVLSGKWGETSIPIADVPSDTEPVTEFRYEKVDADSTAIFRYYMSYAADGTLKVQIDDVPGANRHIVKSAKLTDEARERLNEILTDPEIQTLDREYAGPDGEPPVLKCWRLRILYTTRGRSIHIENTQEPEAFRRVREKLEAFANNELGLWALQYSHEKLIEMAVSAAENGRAKWNDREVEYGNIHAAIRAYREAIVYLDTVNPKPPEFADYKAALEEAEQELEQRYREQRFRADQALKMSDWETARRELKVLCELVPDRRDDRYREAAAKLIDVEKRLGKGARR